MEGIVATLTHEQQTFVRPIRVRGVTTPRTGFASVVAVHFHGQTVRQRGFVGDIAMQFSKGPLGRMPISPALLLTRFLAVLAFRMFADVCQVFQADDAVWVR